MAESASSRLLDHESSPLPCASIRWRLVALIFVGIAIALWSRTAESVAVIIQAQDCGWNSGTEQVQLSSFYYGYAASIFSGGWLSKRFGGHRAMLFSVLGSCAVGAILTPLAGCDIYLAASSRTLSGLIQGD